MPLQNQWDTSNWPLLSNVVFCIIEQGEYWTIPLDVQCISSDHLLDDILAYHICAKSLIKVCAHLKAAMIYFHIDPSQLIENQYANDLTYIT